METVMLTVEGMSCNHCVKAIKDGLMKISGVKEVDVNLDGKQVTVTIDEGTVSRDTLVKAIDDSGYEVTQ